MDSTTITVTGRLSQKQKKSAVVSVAVYGYRQDTPFGKMPKIQRNVPSDHRKFIVQVRAYHPRTTGKNINRPNDRPWA